MEDLPLVMEYRRHSVKRRESGEEYQRTSYQCFVGVLTAKQGCDLIDQWNRMGKAKSPLNPEQFWEYMLVGFSPWKNCT